MKIAATISFLALLPTIGAQCDFCPSGMTAGNETVVPDTGNLTCGDLVESAMLVSTSQVDADACSDLQQAHFWCCPADAGCEFCPTGIENEDVIVAGVNTTCSDYAISKYFAPSDMCDNYTAAEGLCCPKGTGETCVLCENMTNPEGVFNDETCQNLGLYADALSADTDTCPILGLGRSVCCPEEVGPGCTFCKNGVTAPDFEIDDGVTCTGLVPYAKIAPTELCYQLGLAEAVCCPSGGSPGGSPTAAPGDGDGGDDSGSSFGYSVTLCMMMTMLISTRLVKLLGASINAMIIAHVVQQDERNAWNDYARKKNPVWFQESLENEGDTENLDVIVQRTIPFIRTYNVVEGFREEETQRPGEILPIFQLYPLRLDYATNAMTTNYDTSHVKSSGHRPIRNHSETLASPHCIY
eukprot:scaffold7978_cov124-Cylindrotheca_fusiformis.AAC.2